MNPFYLSQEDGLMAEFSSALEKLQQAELPPEASWPDKQEWCDKLNARMKAYWESEEYKKQQEELPRMIQAMNWECDYVC